MKSWPLKVRFGLFCAGLSTLAVLLGVLTARPLIYRHQLRELDATLKENATDLHRSIQNYRGPTPPTGKGLTARLIPPALRRRYLQINGPDGALLHRSTNLGPTDLAPLPLGYHTHTLQQRHARICTHTEGALTIRIGTRLGTIEDMQAHISHILIWLLPATALTVFPIGWWLGRRALRPITQLTEAAETIDSQQGQLPLPTTTDELHRLTTVLNATFTRLQHACAAATRFSGDASHQLRTPIAVLRASLDNLKADPHTPEPIRHELEALQQQTRRLTTLTDDLLLLAAADAGQLQLALAPFDLAPLLHAIAEDTEILCEHRYATLTSTIPPAAWVLGDTRRTAVILQNLAENAVKYSGENGRLTISCHPHPDHTTIILGNTGPGIPLPSQPLIFTRFYRATAQENIRGTGLGLNIAHSLAIAQNGDLQLHSSTPGWTEFHLTLPTAAAPPHST